MSTALPPFGAYLRERRQAAGMSLRAVGKALGCSHVYVSEAERGRRPMSAKYMAKLPIAIPGFAASTGESLAANSSPEILRILARIEALEKRATFAPPTPPLPENEALREVLREAMVSVFLYGNGHGKDLRGALFTIIRHVSPAARDLIDEMGESAAYQRMFGEE